MKEHRKDRIARLRARKAELLGEMKELRGSNVRNKEHKLDRLNEQVMNITERVRELREG